MRASEEAGLSWAEGVPAPKDANGDVVPLTTEAMCYGGKMRRVLRISYSRKDNVWAVQTASVTAPVESFSLHRPDSWEKLEEDLDRSADALDYEACTYFGKSAFDCSSCIADKSETCERVVMCDIADRIRKLRGKD